MTAIAEISGASGTDSVQIGQAGIVQSELTDNTQGPSFASILSTGLARLNEKVATADALVRQFAIDDNVPVHQVTFALEEARLSVELAMQVRQRLVETYRELMNMQL